MAHGKTIHQLSRHKQTEAAVSFCAEAIRPAQDSDCLSMQAKEFSECVPISGIILTKLDGSGRGGAVVSVVDQLGIPVKFVGCWGGH